MFFNWSQIMIMLYTSLMHQFKAKSLKNEVVHFVWKNSIASNFHTTGIEKYHVRRLIWVCYHRNYIYLWYLSPPLPTLIMRVSQLILFHLTSHNEWIIYISTLLFISVYHDILKISNGNGNYIVVDFTLMKCLTIF